jgi:hypothetical protein
LLAILVAILAAVGDPWPGSSSSTASPVAAPTAEPSRDDFREALGEDGGAVPAGTTVFDDDVPGVAKLDPALLEAVRRAATDAGFEFLVDSGWRSAAYQEDLLEEAVTTYGSRKEAARWVATPDTSLHVSGNAVDIGPTDAMSWLSQHGAAYGLCQVYGNEPWHFELRPDAAGEGCPAVYADPTQDPRLHP